MNLQKKLYEARVRQEIMLQATRMTSKESSNFHSVTGENLNVRVTSLDSHSTLGGGRDRTSSFKEDELASGARSAALLDHLVHRMEVKNMISIQRQREEDEQHALQNQANDINKLISTMVQRGTRKIKKTTAQ
jgi:hypothetical protein